MRVSLGNLESHVCQVLGAVEAESTLHHDHPGTQRLGCYR